jgi:hypothetical protein
MSKDIIRMAHEAGVHVYPEFEKAFERFATLVLANNPPQSSIAWQEGYEAGAAAEREACALVCDDFAKYSDWPTADNCAAAIRARSNT